MPVAHQHGPARADLRGYGPAGGQRRQGVRLVADDGKKVWEKHQKPSGHMSLKDLFVVDGLAWTAAIAGNRDDGVWIGYDPKTGEKKREFAPDVHLHWFHHRCYPSKASGKFLITGRNGTEYVDLNEEHWTPNHWFRGGCIYGIMPCNGMTYASMDACGCQLEAKLSGFKALSPARVPQPSPEDLAGAVALGTRARRTGQPRGPAARRERLANVSSRCRRAAAPRPLALKNGGGNWETNLGGRLTQPTIADGASVRRLLATRIPLHALDADTGEPLWSYTTGGQTDTPPTYVNGLVVFGSADGYVYALRADDGSLAWRFRAAPVDQRMMAWEQIESAWPVHGSVLVVKTTGPGDRLLHGRTQHLPGRRNPLPASGRRHRQTARRSRVGRDGSGERRDACTTPT